jgi:16S rRNA (cytidine1402-2'-O)-methyltransferase
VIAYHEHNEARETPRLVARLVAGESIALISDAGTPLVSDPGGRLVRAAVEAGVGVVPVPGASAVLAALVASGLVVDRFSFYGFLARKGKERGSAVAEIVRSSLVCVVYESPNRVAETLAELAAAGAGDRQVVVARELTKKFEEFRRGTVASVAAVLVDVEMRGEVVLVVAGAKAVELDEEMLRERVRALRAGGASARDVVDRLVGELGVARNVAYRLAHDPAHDPT